MSNEYVLREFVCKYCGHTVVVHPNYLKDELPNWCKQCWEQVVAPKMAQRGRELVEGLERLLKQLCSP
jgi:hypothetical protein